MTAARKTGLLRFSASRCLALIVKEWHQIGRDPSALVIGVFLPLFMLLVCGFGISMDMKDVPVAIVLEERTPVAQRIAVDFTANPYFDAKVFYAKAPAEKALEAREVECILTIPAGFAANAQQGEAAELGLTVYGVDSNSATLFKSYVLGQLNSSVTKMVSNGMIESAVASRVSAGPVKSLASRSWFDSSEALVGVYFPNDFDRKGEMMVVSDARNSTTAGIAYGYISSIATQVNAKHGGGLAVEVRDRARWNENGITRYTIVPGLIPVLALIQVLLLAGLSVSREREDGSFDMMLMTPADSIEILIGKAVMPTLIACGQAFLIFEIGFLWFELPFKGSFLLLGLVIFGFSLCMVGLGLGVSAVADNIQQSIVMIIVMMLPMVILSGLMTSVRAMPHWMQTATILNPLRYSIQAIRAVYFEGAGLMDILPLVWPVALVGLGSMSLATYLFRHKIS